MQWFPRARACQLLLLVLTLFQVTPVLAANNAAFVSQTIQPIMGNSQQYAVSVVMQNTGTTTWLSSQNYNLGTQSPRDNTTWGLARVTVPSAIAPNQTATFNFTVTSPAAPGTYNFQWQMVQDGVQWFGVITPLTSEKVTSIQRGGSNFNFYKVDNSNQDWPYEIVNSYAIGTTRQQVQQLLTTMYANGQRQLRIFTWFCHECANVDGNGATQSSPHVESGVTHYLPLQYRQNLANFLSDIRSAGFKRVDMVAGPEWKNEVAGSVGLSAAGTAASAPSVSWCDSNNANYASHPNYYANPPLTAQNLTDLTSENWGVIQELRTIVVSSGLSYLMDIGNEYTPVKGYSAACMYTYNQTIWQDYFSHYGSSDTVGFSIILGSAWDADNRFSQITQIYGSNPPAVFDMHIYCDSSASTQCSLQAGGIAEAASIQRGQMPANYRAIPWIIGETEYNNAASANNLANALINNNVNLQALFQWSGYNSWSTSPATFLNVVPLQFSAYSGDGF